MTTTRCERVCVSSCAALSVIKMRAPCTPCACEVDQCARGFCRASHLSITALPRSCVSSTSLFPHHRRARFASFASLHSPVLHLSNSFSHALIDREDHPPTTTLLLLLLLAMSSTQEPDDGEREGDVHAAPTAEEAEAPSSSPAPAQRVASASAEDDGKVVVLFRATGDAPLLKRAKFKIARSERFAKVYIYTYARVVLLHIAVFSRRLQVSVYIYMYSPCVLCHYAPLSLSLCVYRLWTSFVDKYIVTVWYVISHRDNHAYTALSLSLSLYRKYTCAAYITDSFSYVYVWCIYVCVCFTCSLCIFIAHSRHVWTSACHLCTARTVSRICSSFIMHVSRHGDDDAHSLLHPIRKYIYLSMYVYVCVCVCVWRERERDVSCRKYWLRDEEASRGGIELGVPS